MATERRIELAGRTYAVVKESPLGMDLRGPRGGEYVLIQNRFHPERWALIRGNSRRPDVTWFVQSADGFREVR